MGVGRPEIAAQAHRQGLHPPERRLHAQHAPSFGTEATVAGVSVSAVESRKALRI